MVLATAPTAMTPQETRHFGVLERRIAAGLQTFRDVGVALLEIRDQRLYRETHSSFEAYCSERWALTRPRAYQLMDSARVVAALGAPEALRNEAQARELAPLAAEDAQKVWERVEAVAEETHKPVTASLIRQVRAEVIEPNGGVPVDDVSVTDRLVQDMARLASTYGRWQETHPSAADKRRVTVAKRALVGVLT